ncbi:YY1-associated factor 2-like [Clavelina lepadiformis]|uniref:RanBP2-type domain-containing protein n=1 Tax=Clavelina lepadiformis TaxID=159417 RepID=A0ABP0GI87_CLALP
MSDKKGAVPSRKRISKVLQEEYWDCSVCTYTNSPEAFKCSMCDVRKGTSTRKPRLSQHIVAQQEGRLVAQTPQLSPQGLSPKEEMQTTKTRSESESRVGRPRLKGIDRSTPVTMAVTVNDVTVVFTEFKTKYNPENEESRNKTKHD